MNTIYFYLHQAFKTKNIIFVTILLLAIFIQNNVVSQTNNSNVAIMAYWSLGDAYEFKLTKTEQRWRDNALVKNDSTQYIVKFEVIDSTEDIYRIKWSFKNGISTTYNIPEQFSKTLSEHDVTTIIYTTTKLGVFIEIENWKEISEFTRKLFLEIMDVMSKNDNKKQMQKAIDPLLEIYSSKQGVEQIIFNEIQYFHFPFGVEYSIFDTIKYEQFNPNIVDGKLIKYNNLLFLESIDLSYNHCVLIHQSKTDPKDSKKMILKLLKRMGLKNSEIRKEIKSATFDISEDNRFEFFYYPGIPIKIESSKKIVFGSVQTKLIRIVKITIELVN